MAGQAEKKRIKITSIYSRYYLLAILIVSCLNALYRVLWAYKNITKWSLVGTFLIYGAYYVTYRGITSSLRMGLPYVYYTDVFIVCLVTHFLTTFTPWGWTLLLSIPIFVVYKLTKILLHWIFTPEPELSVDPAFQKKQRKLERNVKAGRIQIVKRKQQV